MREPGESKDDHTPARPEAFGDPQHNEAAHNAYDKQIYPHVLLPPRRPHTPPGCNHRHHHSARQHRSAGSQTAERQIKPGGGHAIFSLRRSDGAMGAMGAMCRILRFLILSGILHDMRSLHLGPRRRAR
jgi:hypothetical protein